MGEIQTASIPRLTKYSSRCDIPLRSPIPSAFESGLDCDLASAASSKDRPHRRRGAACARCWRTNAANLGCARWSRRQRPRQEDRRRLCRERKMLTTERVLSTSTGSKACCSRQGVSGYEPLRRDRRQRLDVLKTGDGRPLPDAFQGADQPGAGSARTFARADQGRGGRAGRDRLLRQQVAGDANASAGDDVARDQRHRSGVRRHPLDRRRSFGSFANRRSESRPTRDWHRHPGRAGRSIASRASRKPAIPDCGQRSSSSPGYGYVISRNRRWLCGLKNGSRRNGGRFKKTTIVALARKLLVALWKYVTAGVVIEGAAMKGCLTIDAGQILKSSRT